MDKIKLAQVTHCMDAYMREENELLTWRFYQMKEERDAAIREIRVLGDGLSALQRRLDEAEEFIEDQILIEAGLQTDVVTLNARIRVLNERILDYDTESD